MQEGIDSLSGYGKVFYTNVMLSGAVPQISLICGPCAGGAAYSPALTDFIIQTRKAQMFITGPQVIKQVTGETVTAEQLGGPEAHMAQLRRDPLHRRRRSPRRRAVPEAAQLSALQQPGRSAASSKATATWIPTRSWNRVVPPEGKQRLRRARGDHARWWISAIFWKCNPATRPNIVIGFARIAGRTVGIIANQPNAQAGVLDINASNKASRFIRFCNAFNIALLTFVDVPGFLPGVEQEHGGIIRHGAKMLFAYSAATVPKITVILRKCYGGAYLAMCGKDLGADRVFAWPTAEVAVMGAEGAAEIVFRKEIQEAEDKAAKRKELIERYREAFSNPYVAAGRRLVDAIIEPALTRQTHRSGARVPAYQARTASAQEARADAAVRPRIISHRLMCPG